MMQPAVLIILPTYNEAANLPSLIDRIHEAVPRAHVLVIDDNSPDGTGRWAEEESHRLPFLRVLHRPSKAGLGSAARDGFAWGLQRGYDVLATLDADGSHDPADLKRMLEHLLQQHDRRVALVIGSRYVAGGRAHNWPLHRRMLSRLVNAVMRKTMGLPTRDNTGALRVYRAAALADVQLDQLSDGFAYLPEIVQLLHRLQYRIVEMPITFVDRQLGRSKANWSEAWGSLRAAWRAVRRRQ